MAIRMKRRQWETVVRECATTPNDKKMSLMTPRFYGHPVVTVEENDVVIFDICEYCLSRSGYTVSLTGENVCMVCGAEVKSQGFDSFVEGNECHEIIDSATVIMYKNARKAYANLTH